MNQKIIQALQLSAFMVDADGTGYLGIEDANAMQKVRTDLGMTSQAIALELLKTSPTVGTAMSVFLVELASFRAAISQDEQEIDLALAFAYLEDHVRETLEREAAKSEGARQFTRLLLALPRLFRWAVLLLVIFIIAVTVRRFLQP